MSDLVEIGPHPARSLEVREDGAVVRVHLAFNIEQDLDRLETNEQQDEVIVTAWVGWRPDASHLRNRQVIAGGGTVTFVDVRLTENLDDRRVRDGAQA
jgi:hypothetical protein